MTGTLVQTSGQQLLDNVSGVVTFNMPAPLTPGNRVILSLVSWPASPSAGNVTCGGAGNVADNRAETAAGDSVKMSLWDTPPIGASPTDVISLTVGAGTYILISAEEWSGLDSGTAFDVKTEGATGNSGTAAVTSPTLNQADELVYAIGGHDNGTNTVITPPTSPWATTMNESDGTAHESGAASYKIVSATTAVTASFGLASAQRWAAVIGTWKLAASGGPSISAQPSEAHKAIGATATFSVTASATGGGTLSYQWKVGGTNVSTGSGGTTASWTTGTLALSDDNSSVTCVVTETGGSNDGSITSTAVLLRVAVLLVSSGVVAYTATGTPTTITPAWPTTAKASVSVGKVVLVVGMKPATSGAGSVTTPSGWTLIGSIQAAGGYTAGGASAADTGNCDLYVYAIDDPGTITGTLSVTLNVGATNGVAWAVMYRYSGPTGSTFSLAIQTGSDTSAGNVSIAFSDPGVDAGDRVLAAMCIPTDVTTPAQFSAEAITQTGVTYGTVTELAEPDTGNNFDIGGFLVDAQATAGPSSAGPTLTATAGGTTTNVRGPGIFLRLRAAAGGTTTPITISVTQVQVPTRARQVSRTLTITAAQALAFLRQVLRTRSATAVQVPVRSRQVARTRTVTQTQVLGSAPVTTGVASTLTVTQTQVATRTRAVGRTVSVTATQAPSRARSLARSLAATASQVLAAVSGFLYTRTVSATALQVLSRARSLGLVRSVTQAQVVAAPGRILNRALLVVALQVLSRTRALARLLNVTSVSAPDQSHIGGGGPTPITISATAAQITSTVRSIARSVTATQAQTPTKTKAFPRVLNATTSQAPSFVKGFAYLRTVSVTAVQVPTRGMIRVVTIAVSQAQSFVVSRLLALRLAVTQVQLPSTRRTINRGVLATSSQSGAFGGGAVSDVEVTATQAQAPSYTYVITLAGLKYAAGGVFGRFRAILTPAGKFRGT